MLRFLVLLCALYLVIPCGEGNLLNLVNPVTESSNEEVFQKWASLDKNFRNVFDDLIKQALPMLLRAGTEVEVRGECTGSLFQLISGIRGLKYWAVQMIDAMGKVPSGLLSGSISDLGAYDECLDIDVPNQFTGQYCALEVRPPLPSKPKQYRLDELLTPLDNFTEQLIPPLEFMKNQAAIFYFLSFRLGACVPSACTIEDVRLIVDNIASKIGININVPRCEVREKFHLENDQIGILCVVGFLVLMCVLGTAVDSFSNSTTASSSTDVTTTKTPSVIRSAFLAFSVPRNLRSLLDTSTTSTLPVLHGIKFISITWIVVGHTYLYVNWQLLRNLIVAKEIIRGFAFQAIANAFVAVDTFFFVSGLLVSYLTIKYLDKNGIASFNAPLSILRRLWRYFPSTAMMIGLTVLIPLLGSGPLWHETTDVLVRACRTTWWANLIFINNIYYTPEACQPTTWYTACDIQLYFVAVIFITILYRYRRGSMLFLIIMIVASIFLSVSITAWQGLPPAIVLISPDPEGVFDYWYYSHFLPHVHLASYAVGLGLGYLLARYPNFELSKRVKVLGWCLAFVCSFSALYGTYSWNALGRPTQAETLSYSGLHRLSWVAGVAWMTIACSSGFGGAITSILSWRGFVPLSRLTFLVYLWHGTIIWLYMGNMEAAIKTSHVVIVWMYLGHLIVAYALATVLHLLYEAPMAKLGRMVLGPWPTTPSKMNVDENDARNGFEKTTVNGVENETIRVEKGANGFQTNNGAVTKRNGIEKTHSRFQVERDSSKDETIHSSRL